MNENITLIYDLKQRKVGCVLIQALADCDSSNTHIFETSQWAVAPTADMRRITGTREEWERLAKGSEPCRKN